MEHPVKVAPCPIYFVSNGGQLDELWRPVVTHKDTETQFARLLCDMAYDCGQCPLLVQWVQGLIAQGISVGWWCPKCVSDTTKKENRLLLGFYQSGRDASLTPEHRLFDPDRPGIGGCTRCGWQTSFLQLVLMGTGRQR